MPDQFTLIHPKELTTHELQNWVNLINQVYLSSEKDFWKKGYWRISAQELSKLIEDQSIILAYLKNEAAGFVRYGMDEKGLGYFSTLVTAPKHRKKGVASELLKEVEGILTGRGCHTLQIELLKSPTRRDEEKERLDQWYRKMGFKLIREDDFFDHYPEKRAVSKETKLRFLILQKSLKT